MKEFKKYRDKPAQAKLPIYKKNMVTLWIMFPFFLAIGIFVLLIGVWYMSDSTPSGVTITVTGPDIIIYVVGALMCTISAILLTFAIIYTIWYRQTKKAKKTETRKVMITVDKDNNITDLYRKKK